MVESKSRHKTVMIAVIAIILIIIAFVVGYWLGLPPFKTSRTEPIAIASFEKEVKGELSSYLNIVIDDYWVEGNKVRVTGRVNWLGGEYAVSDTTVCMFIKEGQPNSVFVKVVVYGGILLLPAGTIDSDSVEIPTLGIDIFSFDFSLTCVDESPLIPKY